MSEYIVDLPVGGAADEFFKLHEMPDMTLYGYPLTGEIVRCRDCEHFEKTVQFGICHRSEFLPMWAELNGFCAWPERKESGE